MAKTLVHGMLGLGDNIYQRAFVRQIPEVAIATPWPELYDDLPNVSFVKRTTTLRTQSKNLRRQPPERWVDERPGWKLIQPGYSSNDFAKGSLLDGLARSFGVERGVFDLPAFEMPERWKDKDICIVRPVTVRAEWRNPARNPMPDYVCRAAKRVMDTTELHVVSVADLQYGAEWLEHPAPPAHEELHKGELSVIELLGAVSHAKLVIGGVGWIVPACIAAGTPLICILGGQGGHNAPEKITDAEMDVSKVAWIRPDRYCMCGEMGHGCNKTISDIERQLDEAMLRLGF